MVTQLAGRGTPRLLLSSALALAPALAGADVVTQWSDIAAATIQVPATPGVGTPEERRPIYSADLATVHIAIYDAVVAIQPTHVPFAAGPATPPEGASVDAAVSAAAHGVLSSLFPNRASIYQGTYDAIVGAIPDGDAKTRGLAVGAEVASAIAALRANDGRSTVVSYTAGSLPGDFRGVNPVNTFGAYVRPFTLTRASQFRADGPPALESATYAIDLAETKALGGAVSRERSAAQLEMARFHTEPPGFFWPRNITRLARGSVADNARLLAAVWVAQADASIACFESKYVYDAWRPQSAIPLADTDGNPDTVADPAWTPVVPTPNHPEYPAAHGCAAGALAETLAQFFGTKRVYLSFDSKVTNTTRNYLSVDAMARELEVARIFGGMHFRTSAVDGGTLGRRTAAWVMEHNFQSQ
jgi:hypothetical protein